MPTEKLAILFNPSAGKGKALKKKDRLERYLRDFGISYDLFITQSEEDLKRLAREKSGKYRILAGAGGDSTIHLIMNEIRKCGSESVLGMIGLGSSNDIAKEFNLDSLEKACLALKRGKTKRIDLGCIVKDNQILSYYLGQANIGLGALVNKYVDELSQREPGFGKIQTVAGTLGIFDSYLSRKVPFPLSIESDHGRLKGHFILAIFSNIRYWATGKKVIPQAQPDDGRLDACLIHMCPLARLVPLALLSIKGKHTEAREVETFQSQSFDVFSEEDFEIQTDGEIVGGFRNPTRFKNIRFEIIPRALNIIC